MASVHHQGALNDCRFSVPQLFLQKVDSDGLFVTVGENASAVALNHARFAYRTVAHYHHLKTIRPVVSVVKRFIERHTTYSCYFLKKSSH